MRAWQIWVAAALCVGLIGCDGGDTEDAGPPGMDAGPGVDAGGGDSDAGTDAGGIDAGGTDAGTDAGDVDAGRTDAGPACMMGMVGACDPSLMCLCCPAGGPAQNCLCTTRCSTDADCMDAARPLCNRPGGAGGAPPGICTPTDFPCAWGAICASPDTPIATPTGERPIAELSVGDLVMTMHEGELVPRPIASISRMAVTDHAVVRVELETGRVLEISGPHPTADGVPFAELAPGDQIDGVGVVAVEMIPFEHAFTHDIRPDSDTGTYVAGGVLIGSTVP